MECTVLNAPQAMSDAKKTHVSLAKTTGQLVVEIADIIHNRTVPGGTQLAEMVQDLIP